MISALFQSRQKSITHNDYNKHHNGPTSFYVISEMKMENLKVVSQTEAFSDQKLIEISKNAQTIVMGDDKNQTEYKRITSMQLQDFQGKNLLHWEVETSSKVKFTVVKLMSPDGCVQFKFISADSKTQWVYNVCELPN